MYNAHMFSLRAESEGHITAVYHFVVQRINIIFFCFVSLSLILVSRFPCLGLVHTTGERTVSMPYGTYDLTAVDWTDVPGCSMLVEQTITIQTITFTYRPLPHASSSPFRVVDFRPHEEVDR